MCARTESHTSQIAKMRIVTHLGDESVGANSEIGECYCLRAHICQFSTWIMLKIRLLGLYIGLNQSSIEKAHRSSLNTSIQLTNKLDCIHGITAGIERFAMLR